MEPKRRGRPPRVMAQPTDRLANLTNREKALALRASARHRYTFDMPLDLYEALLDQAESWGQPLPDVVRACLRKGLDHIKQFGSAERNPYVYGKLNPPAQHDIDPTGQAWPATSDRFQVQPNWDSGQSVVPPMPQIKPGMLPSGATISTSQDAPMAIKGELPAGLKRALEELENDTR